MFGIDFSVLERERKVVVSETIPSDDELWEGAGIALAGPVAARAQGTLMPSGQVLVEGALEGALDAKCKRCLNPVDVAFDVTFTTVFTAEADSENGDGEIRPIPAGAAELDLRPLVREELMLNIPQYAVCREECAGLCSTCGVDLNEESCECTASDQDPRWDALRAMTS